MNVFSVITLDSTTDKSRITGEMLLDHKVFYCRDEAIGYIYSPNGGRYIYYYDSEPEPEEIAFVAFERRDDRQFTHYIIENDID